MESAPTSTSSASSVTSSDGRSGAVGGGSEYLNLGMFGQASGASDLLLGTGGFGGGLGNGYGNDVGLVGSANASSSGSSAFDINDFPSLGGGAGGSSMSTNGLAAALRQQQQLLAHQQMLQSASGSKSPNLYRLAMSSGANAGANFNMATEDFPALPGAPPPSAGGGNTNGSAGEPGNSPLASSGNAVFSVPSMSRVSSGASGSGLYGIDLDGGSNPLESGGSVGSGLLGGLSGMGSLPGSNNPGSTLGHQRSSTPSSTGPGSVGSSAVQGSGAAGSGGGGSTLSGDYGLLGLLGVIRMTDADRNALALGSDLTLLGLNLNSNDQIYSTFSGPWSDNPATKEPQYQVPKCRLDRFDDCALLFACNLVTHPSSVFVMRLASHVLLHATTSIEDGTPRKVSTRDTVLHLLCTSKRCSSSVRCARALHKGMEV